jgi:transcriptional antiterminator NusG
MAFRWYVLHVYSGFENKVEQSLREQIEKKSLQDKFQEILVPSQEVTELRRGKKVKADKKFFPGYILIKMDMNDETWHLVTSTPKVTGFLGAKGRPTPISQVEADRLLKQVSEGVKGAASTLHFEVGEQLRVCDGPFATFTGVVEDVDDERQRLKVMVSIFGRSTPVDLEFSQVEKI